MFPDELTGEQKNQIILALTNNISDDPLQMKSTEYAIKALYHALPYTQQNF